LNPNIATGLNFDEIGFDWEKGLLSFLAEAFNSAPYNSNEQKMTMAIEPGTEEERLMLGRWIKRGQKLIVGTSCLGDSYIDSNVKRTEEVQKQSEEYVAFDHKVSEELPHLKGKFRWDLEKYYRDRYGPYLPED
jgi:hypothetical protein